MIIKDRQILKEFILMYNNNHYTTKEVYDKYTEYFGSILEMNEFYDALVRNIDFEKEEK